MTQQRSGPPEQDGAGDDEREARLRALLSVPIERREPSVTRGAPGQVDASASGPIPEAPPEPMLDVAPPASDPVLRRRPPGWSGGPFGSVLSAVVLLGLFAAGVTLAYVGTRIIRSSTEGEVLEPVDDPAAPGYEAMVEPTPVLALLHDVGGELDAITVVTLPGSSGGGVLFVPRRVIHDLEPFGPTPLETAYNFGTPQIAGEALGDLLGAGVPEVVVVDADRWAGLVAPVAPVRVDNPDDIEIDGEVRFPAGEIDLGADDVGPYLEARVEGQSDLARLYRHEVFWRAWLEAVADAGAAGAVPGELESGVGRFVRTLAGGQAVLEQLPVQDSSSDEHGDEPAFLAEEGDLAALVAELVPFPRTPRPGVRERVRVLNGTTDLEVARRVAPQLPPVGVEVVIVGNASRLDHETTTIGYVGPEHEDAARAIRDVLGAGEVLQDPRPSDVADITVTLGADHD